MKASENPFRSAEIAKLRYRISTADRKVILDALRSGSGSFAIVGPEGTGKTTLLEELHARIDAEAHPAEWHRLCESSSRPERAAVVTRLCRTAHTGRIHFLDGGEVLGPIDWLRLRLAARRGLRLVATLHRNRGFKVLHETRPDWSVARSLLNELASDDELVAIARNAFEQYRGNVREVFRACYWACARR